MEEIIVDGLKYGKKGIDFRKLAWSIGFALLMGFLTGLFTNFDSSGVVVFFLVLYLEYRMK
jgi:hypothetical protein